MGRTYDASRRRKAAEQTRRDILQAALKLHWQGITEYEPLARKAGCSLATLRKHFPTKEDLFQDCTRTFAETLTLPDLPALAAISDPAERIARGVSELCRIHEAMLGYAWLGAHRRQQSPTLEAEMQAYEGLTDAIAGIIAPPGFARGPLLRGLLDSLSYRALRLSGHLSAAQVCTELVTLARQVLADSEEPTRQDKQESTNP